MARILMQGYADPFSALAPLTAIEQHLIGRNSGNLIFSASVLRTLSTENNTIDILTKTNLSSRADEINEKYDHVVLPFANAFRPGYAPLLLNYCNIIEQLKIPVTVVGIGAQAALNYDCSQLRIIEPVVKRFVRAVLDHGPSIGVRGDLTRDYLKSLGFSEVITIGCPSMYYRGRRLEVQKAKSLTRDSKISLNLTPRVPMPKAFNRRHLKHFPNTTYVAQDQTDLEMILGGQPVVGDPDYPGSLEHPYLVRDRTVMYLNAQRWISDMADYDFTFGTRIHGNVAALLAGSPCHVIAHDSRTRELAEYFQIPFTLSTALKKRTTAQDLFESSDFGPMMSGHEARFQRFVDYLDAHRLPHIFRTEESTASNVFDRKMREATFGEESKVGVRTTHPSHVVARQLISNRYLHRRLNEISASVAKCQALLEESPGSPRLSPTTRRGRIAAQLDRLGLEGVAALLSPEDRTRSKS